MRTALYLVGGKNHGACEACGKDKDGFSISPSIWHAKRPASGRAGEAHPEPS